jgi:hypothetical protein
VTRRARVVLRSEFIGSTVLSVDESLKLVLGAHDPRDRIAEVGSARVGLLLVDEPQ